MIQLRRDLTLAHHVERLVEAGELAGYAEAARVLGVTRARLTQVMNLLLLAPAVQDRILCGKLKTSERKLRAVVTRAAWTGQLEQLVAHGISLPLGEAESPGETVG